MGAHIRSSYKSFALGAALCCSAIFGDTNHAAATGAPHGFIGGAPTHAFKSEGQMHRAQAMHRHFPQGQFAGNGMPFYLSGSFEEPYGADEGENYGGDGGRYAYPYPYPYPPPYAVWRAAMPRPCVTPLVIELGKADHPAKLPKVTYGSSPGACPPPIIEAKH